MEPHEPQTTPSPAAAPAPVSGWSNIVKQQPPQQQAPTATATNHPVLVESCKSTHGISVAVIDANAVIQGGEKLNNLAEKFVTVPEVLAEIRDPISRHRLSFIPFSIDSMEPAPESLKKVIKFARETGDLQTLSDVDLKLIALNYTLEAQIHGTSHLRDAPPPIHTINVKRLPEKDLPGWGSNVPNLDEWEALEGESGDAEKGQNSRILPLKDINLNVVPMEGEQGGDDGSVGTGEELGLENSEDGEHGSRRYRRYPPKRSEVNIEGKKMVAAGVDASQGQVEDESGDWMPAVSRSTHRRFLRRKARREYNEALLEKERLEDLEKSADDKSIIVEESGNQNAVNGISEEGEVTESKNSDEDISSILKQMRVDEGLQENAQEEKEEEDNVRAEASLDSNGDNTAEAGEVHADNADLDHVEVSSETQESVDVSYTDDNGSEQSWMLRSLSESSVACVTSDFAMQNVLLQMGLRLLAPGGIQIRQLQRWVLKCHACYTVTAEIGRIFCPKCGNGGTLRKVAVTVGENGITLAAHRPRISLRGTKFSLPLPQGGRDAITKNVILREDQLPQKFLYPKTKKKANKQEGDDFFLSDNVFSHHGDRKTSYQPPIRKALAVFSGKRNPNDNHYSRPKH
ncbi:hypothetical protein Tsubulata_010253 [Turnera subulata]|uniref:RNA-binding protein NOB1 n=1 Tax=Turnera subulata TaxID=218843 RepID=A0A9Q0GGA3_9ROSI|nr:hypothetical protein Tsubulata_010253 [Turnera subulata]